MPDAPSKYVIPASRSDRAERTTGGNPVKRQCIHFIGEAWLGRISRHCLNPVAATCLGSRLRRLRHRRVRDAGMTVGRVLVPADHLSLY